MLHRAILLLSLLASLASGSCTMRPDHPTATAHLAHDVFFTLKDNSPEQCRRLVTACEERLAPLPGIVFFAAGTRAPDLQRDVNDQVNLNLQTLRSKLEDVDLAKAITQLSQESTALTAAQQAFVKVQGLSLFNYL